MKRQAISLAKSPWKGLLLTGSVLAILTACGDDMVTENTRFNVFVVAGVEELPACEKSNEGEQVFVTSKASLQVCANSKWHSITQDANESIDFHCSTEPLTDGSGLKIICGGDSIGFLLNGHDSVNDSSSINVKNGIDGKDGADGKDGKDGTSCSAVTLSDNSGMKIICGGDSVGVVLNGRDGENGADGKNGTDGKDGSDGKDGTNGVDGTGCSLEQIDVNTLRIVCGKDSATFLVNEVLNPNSSSSSLTSASSSSIEYLATPCKIDGVDTCRHGILTDKRDGKKYLTVVIGDQEWMAENLDYDTSGSVIYNNAGSGYGRLYMWATAIAMPSSECGYGKVCTLPQNHQGICPQGWHLPDSKEWSTLYAMTRSAKALMSTYGWNDFNEESGNGTDLFAFSALPVGYYDGLYQTYRYVGSRAFFWRSGYNTSQYAGHAAVHNVDDNMSFGEFNDKRYDANSVRCVKNKN